MNRLNRHLLGAKVFDQADLQEIAEYIDWQPFFIAWEMHGKFPQILSDAIIGEEATKLYNDAQTLLKKIIDEKWLTPRGVIGFWPANATADDTVTIEADESAGISVPLEFLRQQSKKAAGQPNISLADFIAPSESGKTDYIGAFSVTIQGIEKHITAFHGRTWMIITRSSCRHWPTVWPKHLRNCCIKK